MDEWVVERSTFLSYMIRHGTLIRTPWLANLTTVRLKELHGDKGTWFYNLSDLSLFNSLPIRQSLTAWNVSHCPDTIDEYLYWDHFEPCWIQQGIAASVKSKLQTLIISGPPCLGS